MPYKRKYYPILLLILGMILLSFQVAQTQNWVAMPPYNVLWPLWSPILSPLNAAGIPTPLVTELTRNTILPVQPCIAYDPYILDLPGPATGWPMGWQPPWLLYNGPAGLLFFDTLYGLNPWPPPSFLDAATGAPIPITLPLLYSLSPLPDLKETQYIFELANLTYLLGYGDILGVAPASLLTFADIWPSPIFFAGGIP